MYTRDMNFTNNASRVVSMGYGYLQPFAFILHHAITRLPCPHWSKAENVSKFRAKKMCLCSIPNIVITTITTAITKTIISICAC